MRLQSIVAVAALAPVLLAATEPVRLSPSSPWVLDYAENSCRLVRTFGQGKSAVKLGFESDAPEQLDLLVVGQPLQTSAEKVTARFLPVGGKGFDGRVLRTEKGIPAILWSRLDMFPESVIQKLEKERDQRTKHPDVRPQPLDLAEQAFRKAQQREFAAAATELGIETRRNRPVILETGSLGAAITMFEKCSRDSLKDWGVDPELEDKIVRPVWAAHPEKWFSPSDYPPDLVNLGRDSDVKVRLLVDASGKVTKCTSLSHYDRVEFNKIVCDKFVERAAFEPAELADGTKVSSYYTNVVSFRIGF